MVVVLNFERLSETCQSINLITFSTKCTNSTNGTKEEVSKNFVDKTLWTTNFVVNRSNDFCYSMDIREYLRFSRAQSPNMNNSYHAPRTTKSTAYPIHSRYLSYSELLNSKFLGCFLRELETNISNVTSRSKRSSFKLNNNTLSSLSKNKHLSNRSPQPSYAPPSEQAKPLSQAISNLTRTQRRANIASHRSYNPANTTQKHKQQIEQSLADSYFERHVDAVMASRLKLQEVLCGKTACTSQYGHGESFANTDQQNLSTITSSLTRYLNKVIFL